MNEISKQIALIEEFVRFAEGIPTELSEVKIYLGYDTSGDPVLAPASMQALFIEIRDQVDLWKKLSTQARKQLRELSITAATVVKNGSGLMRGLNALGPVDQLLNTVGEASIDSDSFQGTGVVLDEATLTRLNHLQPYIDALHNTSLDSLGDTNATNQLIADFRTKSSILEAHVAKKVDSLKDGNDKQLGKEKTVGPVIEAFRDACSRIVAEFGEGSEGALAVQKQVKNTISELTDREPGLQKQQRLTYAVGRLFVHLQGLGYAMVYAQSALTNIWLTSSNSCTSLKSIASNLGDIGTEETLLTFYISYKEVLSDWTFIRDDASSLYKAL